jgi:hypothetical protein
MIGYLVHGEGPDGDGQLGCRLEESWNDLIGKELHMVLLPLRFLVHKRNPNKAKLAVLTPPSSRFWFLTVLGTWRSSEALRRSPSRKMESVEFF